jgi:guanine deaminase
MFTHMTDEEYMRLAIEKAREGIENGQLPFGACIVQDGKVVACMHNTILRDGDVTAHAEMNSIHEACRALNTLDLTGCTIYCTCEPCPMCLGALGLANVDQVVYGTRISDVRLDDFTVLETPRELFRIIGNGKMKARGSFLREENVRLLEAWEKRRY